MRYLCAVTLSKRQDFLCVFLTLIILHFVTEYSNSEAHLYGRSDAASLTVFLSEIVHT